MPRCRIGWLLVPLAAALLAGGCSRSKTQADEPARPSEAARPAEYAAGPAPWPVRQPAPRMPAGNAGELLSRLEAGRPAPPRHFVNGPWADAKVGSFATYRGAGGLTVTKTVVEVAAGAVTLEVSATQSGKRTSRRLSVPRIVPDGQRAHSVPPEADWSTQDVRIGTRRIACRVATWQKSSGRHSRQVRIVVSDDVPGQLVSSAQIDAEGNAKVSWELIDFGP